MNPKIAIIGGTGICDPSLLTDVREEHLKTPYGVARLYVGLWHDREVVFLARHASSGSAKRESNWLPPHKINYRANIWALKSLEIERILATAATGSLNCAMKPGSLALLTQFIDFTKTRESTFYEGDQTCHVDLTEPYCPEIRDALYQAALDEDVECSPSATYACTEGPRFETPAEIRAFQMLGAELVGMTSVPEVVLAREMEICYGSIAIVTNMAAGISDCRLTAREVEEMMESILPKLASILRRTIDKIPQPRKCACKDALKDAKV